MAQLRQDSRKSADRNAEIVVFGPDRQQAFKNYWQKEEIPFVGLADPAHTIAKRYGQEVKLLRWGHMPALVVIDKAGQLAFKHYGGSMSDIPPNAQSFPYWMGFTRERVSLANDLPIDWRWGERSFSQHLVDGEPAWTTPWPGSGP